MPNDLSNICAPSVEDVVKPFPDNGIVREGATKKTPVLLRIVNKCFAPKETYHSSFFCLGFFYNDPQHTQKQWIQGQNIYQLKKVKNNLTRGPPQFGHWAMPKRTGFFSVEVFLKEEQFRKLFMPIMFFYATFRSCLRFLYGQAIELTLKAELSQAPRPALPCKHG